MFEFRDFSILFQLFVIKGKIISNFNTSIFINIISDSDAAEVAAPELDTPLTNAEIVTSSEPCVSTEKINVLNEHILESNENVNAYHCIAICNSYHTFFFHFILKNDIFPSPGSRDYFNYTNSGFSHCGTFRYISGFIFIY